MNLASWIILGIVVAILALAVKATFFKKERRGGCCDVGDDLPKLSCACDCSCCSACHGCSMKQ